MVLKDLVVQIYRGFLHALHPHHVVGNACKNNGEIEQQDHKDLVPSPNAYPYPNPYPITLTLSLTLIPGQDENYSF
jgi:hypothetical protein